MSRYKNRNPPHVFSQTLPNNFEEDFPQLSKDPLDYREKPFKRYLVIKHNDPNTKMSDLNPFDIDRKIKSVLGKKHTCKVNRLRSGLLLIEVDRKQDFDKLMKTKKLQDIPVVIEEHSTLNTSKGLIYCDNDSIKRMSNEEIKTEMENQNVTEVYRIMKRVGNGHDPTNLFIVTFGDPSLPKDVKIGYLHVEVKLYIPNPRRCFKCQRYGHGKNTCTHETVCALCGESGHEYGSDECDKEKKCYHCEQDHEASSRDCPMWILEKEILKEHLSKNITLKQARTNVYSSNPDLITQIPRISVPKSKASYSSVSAQSTAIHQQLVQQQQQISLLTTQISDLLEVIRQSHSSSMSTRSDIVNKPSTSLIQKMDDLPSIAVVPSNKRRNSVSSSEDQPSKQPRAPSSRQEGISRPANQALSSEAGEKPSHRGKSTAEGAEGEEEEEWEMATGSPRRHSRPPPPPSDVPPAPPGQTVKEGVKAGSSGPGDKRGVVSNKGNPKYSHIKSKITAPR